MKNVFLHLGKRIYVSNKLQSEVLSKILMFKSSLNSPSNYSFLILCFPVSQRVSINISYFLGSFILEIRNNLYAVEQESVLYMFGQEEM